MAITLALKYPIQVEFEHDDIPDGIVVDEWGDNPYYVVKAINWINLTEVDWTVFIQAVNGKQWKFTIDALDFGSINLATPARFNSFPLDFHCSLFR